MKIICWNVRGIGNKGTQDYLKHLISVDHYDIMAILEPKIDHSRIDDIARYLGFTNFRAGENNNKHIWLFWNQHSALENFYWHNQFVSLDVLVNGCLLFRWSVVYASTCQQERLILYEDILSNAGSNSQPWLVSGDFNAIASWSEKKGGDEEDDGSMADFIQFQMDAGLTDAGYSGSKYTWSNNHRGDTRIWERLDRVLVNGHALAKFPNMNVRHGARIKSDHCPLIFLLNDQNERKSFFHYLNIWEENSSFRSVVEEAWKGTLHSNPLVNFGLKLQRLRKVIRKWNREVFGHLSIKKKELEHRVTLLEDKLQLLWESDTEKELVIAKGELGDIIAQEISLIKQKCRLSWLKDGDANSAFFHASLKVKRSNSTVRFQNAEDEDDVLSDEQIGMQAVAFYSDLMTGYAPPPGLDNFGLFDKVISDEENNFLLECPTEEEVHKEIAEMKQDTSPGPDGFSGRFYITFWNSIKCDLMKAFEAFFKGFQIPSCIGATYLTLIPKGAVCSGITDLRPISLCNFLHKIFSRVINSRLAGLLHRIVSKEQFGFVKGRCIHESIALAHDLTYDLNTETRGGNIIVKLDMSKAYDRISWSFVMDALRANGFSEKVVDLVFRCISASHFSIKWNGQVYGHFKSACGLRQGDPLSPTLFVIAMEWLSKALNQAVSEGSINSYYTGYRMPYVNHILFADDILIFSNGCKDSVENLMSLVNEFCELSGQKLNDSKSSIFFGSGISLARQRIILGITKFTAGVFPVNYLGVPLFVGMTKIIYFQALEEKVRSRISGWMKNLLTMGGKLTLIDSVLSTVGIHCMSVLSIPKTVLNRLRSLMASFLWDKGSERRRHWVAWDKITVPVECGGLGVKDLENMMLSLHGKMAWNHIVSDSLWAEFSRKRHRHGVKGSRIWSNIDHLVSHLKENSKWLIGEGSIKADAFLRKFNVKAPDTLANLALRDIIIEPEMSALLHQCIPLAQSHNYQNMEVSTGADRFIWCGSKSGEFSAKDFRATFVTRWPLVKWGKLIWKSWLPRKVSCFVWKFFNNAIPTDERIRSIGFQLVSKCVCCESPNVESGNHLFFHSDLASVAWDFCKKILNYNRPYGKISLLNLFFKEEPSDSNSAMRLGLISCTLWELWKWRNCMRYDGKVQEIKAKLFQWSKDLLILISSKFKAHAPVLSPLQVSRGMAGDSDFVVSSGLINRNGKICGAAVFKPVNGGRWTIYTTLIPEGNGLGELLYFLSKIISAARLNGFPIKKIFCSNYFMDWLSPSEEDVPWNELCRVRVFRAKFKCICFRRICPRSNSAALAVAEAFAQQRNPLLDVPFVKQAFASERLGSAICCYTRACVDCVEHPMLLAFPQSAQDDGSGRATVF